LLLDRLTATPPAGAAAARTTVPVVKLPPGTVEGDTETAVRVAKLAGGGLSVKAVVTELVEMAVMVTVCVALTVLVVTGKVAEIWPAGMVIPVATEADGLLVDKLTFTPPSGAAAASVTVPALLLPPITVDGETEIAVRIARLAVGGLTVRAVLTELADVAVMATLWLAGTVVVVTKNVVEVAPAGTVMAAGTVAAALLHDKLTVEPPAGAAAARLTVPVVLLPPVTVAGETETEVSVAGLAGGGLMVSVVLTEFVDVAVMVAIPMTLTVLVESEKVAEV